MGVKDTSSENEYIKKCYKEYYNERLSVILKKYITEKRYGVFSKILEEIFQRRAYEYEFSEAEIEEQVINFTKNVKKIKFAPGKRFDGKDIGAIYRRGKILLNQDFYSNREKEYSPYYLGLNLYETLTHEVYHAIADIGMDIGLTYFDYESLKRKGIALDEVITEVSASRTVFSKTDEFDTYTDGYEEITFSFNLLAAALGITEKELIKSAKNRQSLIELLNSRFPDEESRKTAKTSFFDKFEASLDILYNIYKSDEPETEVDLELKTSALSSLYESCYDLASFQIASDKINTSSKYVAETIYRFLKIGIILEDAFISLENREKPVLEFIRATDESRKKLADKLMAMYELSKNFEAFPDYGSYYEEFANVKKGMDDEKRNYIAEKYGIEIPEKSVKTLNSMEPDPEYSEYILKEDLDNKKVWRNDEISNAMISIYVSEMEKRGIRSRLGNAQNENGILPYKGSSIDKVIIAIRTLITKFKNKSIPQVDSPNDTNSSAKYVRESEFDKRYRVDVNRIDRNSTNEINDSPRHIEHRKNVDENQYVSDEK